MSWLLKIPVWLGLVLLEVQCGVSLGSGLEWTPERIRIAADDLVAIQTNFVVVNNSERTVRIRSIQPDCGCTVADLSTSVLEPGDTAILSVDIRTMLESRSITRKISVTTDDPDARETTLFIQITALIPAVVHPSVIAWNAEDAGARKTVRFEPWTNSPIRISQLVYDTNSYAAVVDVAPDGAARTITVTPINSPKRGSAYLEIVTDYPPSNPKSYTVLLQQVERSGLGLDR